MEHQFDTLESAHDFVKLLAATVAEAKRELENDAQRESLSSRRLDALRIALYNLTKLEIHVSQTSRLLNDLRTLRRVLFEERRHSLSLGAARPRLPRDDRPTGAVSVDQSVAA